MMCKTDICFCIVKKIGKVFRIKTQTGQSAMFFCVLGKRERFLVEEMQTALSFGKECNYKLSYEGISERNS